VNGGCFQGPVCTNELSGIGLGDVRISFTIQTTQPATSGGFVGIEVMNQRNVCNPDAFWDIRVAGNGTLEAETDGFTDGGGTIYTALYSCGPINDGAAHAVILQRSDLFLTMYVDGIVAASGASGAGWGDLAPLRIGDGPCVSGSVVAKFDFTKGSITNICMSPRSSTPPVVKDASCF
jgi:hypothetical protein